jgi:hypothetical protein
MMPIVSPGFNKGGFILLSCWSGIYDYIELTIIMTYNQREER